MNQDEYTKRLEEVAKRAKKGDFELSDLLGRTSDYVDDSIRYRNLMEDTVGNEYLKNTGISVPNIKNASRAEIERFTRDLLEENYGNDLGLKGIELDNKLSGYGAYDPNNKKVIINPNKFKTRSAAQNTGDALHEFGHVYDDSTGLWKNSINLGEMTKEKIEALKKMGITRDNAHLFDIDDVAEVVSKGHHYELPERLKSWSRSALENLVNGRRLKQLAIPAAIGTGMIATSGDASASDSLMDEEPKISNLESGARGLADNLSFGTADEIAGAIDNPMGAAKKTLNYLGADYNDSDVKDYMKGRDESREAYKAAEKANPKSYAVGETIGILAPLALTMGGSAGLSGAKALAAGATMSATDRVGRSEAENLPELAKEAAEGAGTDIAFGAALPVVGRGLSKGKDVLKNLNNLRKLH